MDNSQSFCLVPAANCPFAVRQPRVKPKWQQSLAAAIATGVLVGTFFVGVGYAIYTKTQPPVVIQNSTIMNYEVVQDGELTFSITSMMSVDLSCVGSVTREFFQWEQVGDKKLRHKKRNAGAAPIIVPEERDYIVDVPLPPNLAPGDWNFMGETTYDCGYVWAFVKDFPRGLLNGGVLKFRTKVMPFKVVSKN